MEQEDSVNQVLKLVGNMGIEQHAPTPVPSSLMGVFGFVTDLILDLSILPMEICSMSSLVVLHTNVGK
jgi:hypothetical protein